VTGGAWRDQRATWFGPLETHLADACAGHGGYANAIPVHEREGLQRHPIWRAHGGGGLRQPASCSSIPLLPPRRAPGQAHLMSESLRNDGRLGCRSAGGRTRPEAIRSGARLLPRARYPRYGNTSSGALGSRPPRPSATRPRHGAGWPGFYLDLAEPRASAWSPRERYGTSRDVAQITGDDPLRGACASPRPALHHGGSGWTTTS